MQNKTTSVVVGSLIIAGVSLVGWQSWNTHQLQQQLSQLQQQLTNQGTGVPNSMVLGSMPSPSTSLAPPSAPQSSPFSQQVPLSGSPVNPSGGQDPFGGNGDPFAQMQQMQAQMHQHMQELMKNFGMGNMGPSLFDMDEPFQGPKGFSSSMGFGADPEFQFNETPAAYEVSIAIPEGSQVEINTQVKGNDLTIEGKVTIDSSQPSNNSHFRSMQTRQFARTLRLPDDVDMLGITNVTQNGKVMVTIPKKAGGSSKQVKPVL